MTHYLYATSGSAVGFIAGRYVHALNGWAIGQLNGHHVRRLDGRYVGELYDDQVVNMSFGTRGTLETPGIQAIPVRPETRATGGTEAVRTRTSSAHFCSGRFPNAQEGRTRPYPAAPHADERMMAWVRFHLTSSSPRFGQYL